MKIQKTFYRTLLVLFFIVFFMPSAFAFEITSFYPDTWINGEGDEFFVLSGQGSLSGVLITDGEGSVRFPGGSVCRGNVTVAREGRIYAEVHKIPPDYEIYDTDPKIPDVIRTGSFRMGNAGDSLTLLLNKKIIQEIFWPGDVKKGEGRVHILKDGVWDERPFYIGQSDFGPVTYYNVSLTAFVSPDCSYEVLEDVISEAESSINLNVYEFTNPDIAEMIAGKRKDGLDVRVLLEGSPVGGISPSEYYAVSEISGAGVSVYSMETENGVFHSPYRYSHAKYMTTDKECILLTSENFGYTGFPKPGITGNRGYGVYIRDSGVASYFDNVFETDISGGFIETFPEKTGSPEEFSEEGYSPVFKPEVFSGVSVTPVLSPDTSYLIPALIESAQVSVVIEQAYIKNWSSGENPYLEAAISAARRGVSVRILMDSYWYNTGSDSDNDEMADYINAVSLSENLSLGAALVDLDSLGVVKIHNKAVVVDGESVLVSSVNWNENSPEYNREAGVILSGGGVGEYYQKVFDYDWERRQGKVSGGIFDINSEEGMGDLKVILAILVITAFILVYIRKKI